MINSLDRIEGLMSGKLKPKDEYEELFLVGYAEALQQKKILHKYIEIFHDIDDDVLLLHSFLMGYALGQQKLEEEIADFNKEGGGSNH